jgi:hypothetical protein
VTRIEWIIAAMAKAWSLTSPIVGPVPRDIAAAIETAMVEKPLFAGAEGWRQSASFEISLSRYESGNRQVVGDCKGLKAGDPHCGEPGTEPQSFCFLQIHLPHGAKTAEGWSGADLMADPLKCARAGREIIRRSILQGPADEPLKLYAGSSKLGRTRTDLAKQIYQLVPFTPDGGAM